MDSTLVYLYGIVPADAPDPPADLEGIDGSPIRLHRIGAVAAVFSHLPATDYQDDALNARLDDLVWVGDRGLAHERVLEWFAQRGPVIPLSLFSLHRDLDRLDERIAPEEDSFLRVLQRLRGRREWGIKLWRQEAACREGIDRWSPSLDELSKEIDAAPPGKRFLLERKREAMRTEEIRTISKRVTHELFAALRKTAEAGVSIPIPPTTANEKALLLQAAFLVDEALFPKFHEAIGDQARNLVGSGFEMEFTGPWPPYHFTTPDE
jgi:hypothetical protein